MTRRPREAHSTDFPLLEKEATSSRVFARVNFHLNRCWADRLIIDDFWTGAE
jgi:hypothetical protein